MNYSSLLFSPADLQDGASSRPAEEPTQVEDSTSLQSDATDQPSVQETDSSVKTSVEASSESPISEPTLEVKQSENEIPVAAPSADEDKKEAPASQPQEEASSEDADAPASTIEELPVEKPKEYSDKELAKLSCADIVEAVAILLQQPTLPTRQEVDRYKAAFFKLKNSFSSDPELKEELQDAEVQEIRFKDLMNNFREQNRARIERLKEKRAMNLVKKKELVEELRQLLTSQENFSQIKAAFHDLGDRWRAVGVIPDSSEANKLHREYSQLVEQFYDLKQINDEFRDYDFRKNLETKQELIARAKELLDMADTIAAVKELRHLHDLWRDSGPVAREFRESIWQEFKEVSSQVHKRNQAFFDEKHKAEAESLQSKEQACTQIEEMNQSEPLNSVSAWNKATSRVLDIQKEWRTFGYSGKKHNDAIYTRFRAACDEFFDKRTAYFESISGDVEERLEKRKEIADAAEQILQEEVTGKNAARMRALQEEWREVGFTPRKADAALRKRFLTATKTFFRMLKEKRNEQGQEERENLEAKEALIAQAEEWLQQDTLEDEDAVANLVDQFRQIGFVPFSKKDKINNGFYSLVDQLAAKFKVRKFNRKRPTSGYRGRSANNENLSEVQKLHNERERLFRQKDKIKGDLQTYTNNLGFLNVSSSKGNSLLQGIEQQQEKLQKELDQIEEKISAVNKQIDEANAAQDKESNKEA